MTKKSITLLTILVGSLLFAPQSAPAQESNNLLDAPPENISNSDNYLQVLSNAQGIEGAYIGYAAAPNPAYKPIKIAFQQALADKNSNSIGELRELMNQASPAGRIYIAALIQRLDKTEGDRILTALQSDSSVVTERSGCTIGGRTVGDLATDLLKNGSIAIALP
ncbi:MAG: hypothetical protein KME17_30160 [Cyanosarcina radialis HA8281-LM2]|jgi:hypothetical protein|nr:hypothetical protein [Cyanosarcina radialis HA8281-LM2]